ncbi:hypothetical protein M441DRAFT_387878 [Trichoderma asperellum CBS 433.97]|uniref:Uncharacterized protein n=1 Tax=Trichoderma asperellum (strain ATCC 204424 / CBS 433.97 / NBRC 101777) TaxID=1042311 RepID=A0A2T3ZBY0_TRIA4|nr:hypothetical protein M441DRAFT_387878 [Trichoderma asperellum CBS 433.97]PTB42311.1 hypothetical protein M441DRAFT_387878 [Trichoderma asperellum CBS 433.97]
MSRSAGERSGRFGGERCTSQYLWQPLLYRALSRRSTSRCLFERTSLECWYSIKRLSVGSLLQASDMRSPGGGYVVITSQPAPPRTRSVRHSHWAPLRTSQLTCTLEPEAAKPAKPQHIFSGSLVVSQGLGGESEWGHRLAHLCSIEGWWLELTAVPSCQLPATATAQQLMEV